MSSRSGSQLESYRFTLWIASLSFVVALAATGAWVAAEARQLTSPSARLGLLAVLAVAAVVSCLLGVQTVGRGRKRAIHTLKVLCQTNYSEVGERHCLGNLIEPGLSPAWNQALSQVSELLYEQAIRLAEAEQSRALAELKLKQQAGEHWQLKQILDFLQDPVVAIDRFNEVSYMNESAAKLFQLTAGTLDAGAAASLFQCEQLVSLLVETNQHKAQTVRTTEAPIAGHAGEDQWYRIRCRSLAGRDADQAARESSGAVAVLRDINEQKHMQRRNAEFVSAVSHEMKTPLTGIKAYVELLADGDAEDPATREEFLGVINSQADRLQRLIENMLDLARIEAGVVEVNKHQISLNEVLQRAVEVVAPAAEAKQLELANELSPMYLGVLADHDMLLQAAINLLSNAIKYTAPGGQVIIRSCLLGSDIAFEVSDTGVGLSPEDCQRVFDKFYRVKKDSSMAPGTGLGLPLAKHIVEDVHGGRLELESKLGVGSTFRITLTEQNQIPALV